MSNLNIWGQGYAPPSDSDIKDILSELNMTGQDCADMVGVASSRTVRRWTSGDAKIPYSAWRMLLLKAGKIEQIF